MYTFKRSFLSIENNNNRNLKVQQCCQHFGVKKSWIRQKKAETIQKKNEKISYYNF